MSDDLPQVTIYTDGGCWPTNPGKVGAWGAVLRIGDHYKTFSGRYEGERITNIHAEMTAALEALRALKKPCRVKVYSDLQLLVKCGNGEWQRNANRDLWEQIDKLCTMHSVTFYWVKGHSGDFDNELCHNLVTKELQWTL